MLSLAPAVWALALLGCGLRHSAPDNGPATTGTPSQDAAIVDSRAAPGDPDGSPAGDAGISDTTIAVPSGDGQAPVDAHVGPEAGPDAGPDAAATDAGIAPDATLDCQRFNTEPCEACRRTGVCGAGWSRFRRSRGDCPGSYLCISANCFGPDLCSCVPTCLPLEPGPCHVLWNEIKRCYLEQCAAVCGP
ncbi:MAG: hypothetical protein MJD61_15260 [Proteobacteria bacterium]|nr:hypothetical protein [Pseudomonadota bacterium]